MSDVVANPYINFQGQTREAMEFYQRALGGKLELTAFSEDGTPREAGPDDRVMHAMLVVGGMRIMGSDGHPDYPPTVGDNMAIALYGTDREFLTTAFDKLPEGGTVMQALKTESWGDSFGYFVDKYGINWMVNINGQQ